MDYVYHLLQQPVGHYAATAIYGMYNLRLVVISYLLVALSAYATLELESRVAATRGRAYAMWLLGSAAALGTGIWAMHFTGMLALNLDMRLVYDAPLVLLSLLIAIVASGFGLFMIRRPLSSVRHVLAGGGGMGLGIALMHYVGMAAMRMTALTTYQPLLVCLSACVAVGAACVALGIALRFRGVRRGSWLWMAKLGSAFAIGAAITAIHYISMLSASFTPVSFSPPTSRLDIESFELGGAIGLMTIVILGFTLLSAFIDRRFSAQSAAFESLFLHHPDAVFSLDPSGVIQSANPAAETMTGQPVHALLRTPFTALMAADDAERTARYLQEVAQGRPKRYELKIRHASDQKAFASITSVPIVVDDQMTGMYVFAKDITSQRRAEEERARLITILEATTDIVGTAHLDGHVLYCNQAGRKMFGWEREGALAHRTIAHCYAPETQAFMFNIAIPAAIRDGIWSGEGTIVDEQGQEVPISQVIIAHKNSDGSIMSVSNVARDITDRKRAEEALQAERTQLERRIAERTAELSAANAELARAARLKDEFLANMSHELRTPLNAILGLSEALQEGIYGIVNTDQANAMHGIEESGRHLLTLINDILDLSKIEAGKLTLNLDVAYVEEIARASLRMINQIAQQKQITVSATFDDKVSVLWADARRLKQVLVNLLSNSVKFTPRGGAIGIDIAGDCEHQKVYFTIWDTGIGIDKDNMQELFHPFVQVDSSYTRQYEGSGLGLALVSRMVALHGGSISVDSTVGKGSRFTITLPWRVPDEAGDLASVLARHGQSFPSLATHMLAPPESPILRAVCEPPDHAPLIMLAEDNDANVATFADYLMAKGYRVIVAHNGREALTRSLDVHPDLILMDIQMPNMDGIEVIRCLRSDPALMHTPIIALTALAMDGDRERCLHIGANDYLSKPVSLQRLADAIEAQLNSLELNQRRNYESAEHDLNCR